MKPFYKEKHPDGSRCIYLCGIKILSYKKKQTKYDQIFARRFEGLTLDEIRYCLEKQFSKKTGSPLNLDNPQTFNEKLQWLKLYYHRHPEPLLVKCADKVGMREYVKEKIGENYLIPCLGVWDSPDAIDFDKLPEQFVLKVNWGSGQNIIVKDKSQLDIAKTKRQLAKWMKPESNHYYNHFEPSYKDIVPKVIAEKYLEQMDGKLFDYKFFCFNGIPYYCEIDVDRFTKHTRCFYDMNYQKKEFTLSHPLYEGEIGKPSNFDQMKEIVKILSSQFPHVRVDLFIVNDNIYIGEMTFFHGSGYSKFYPSEWCEKFGDLLILPKEE